MNNVFLKAAELVQKDYPSIKGKWWVKNVGNWTLALHGKDENQEFEPEGCMPVSVERGELVVWWNGFLAGIITPFGGVIAAGSMANEEKLIADLTEELG